MFSVYEREIENNCDLLTHISSTIRKKRTDNGLLCTGPLIFGDHFLNNFSQIVKQFRFRIS